MNTSMYKPEGFIIGNTEGRESYYSQSALEKAAATGKILEAQATLCDSEMALTVDLGCMKGKIPKEEAVYNASSRNIHLQIACGYAVFDPRTDTNLDALQKRADQNMYENKKQLKTFSYR